MECAEYEPKNRPNFSTILNKLKALLEQLPEEDGIEGETYNTESCTEEEDDGLFVDLLLVCYQVFSNFNIYCCFTISQTMMILLKCQGTLQILQSILFGSSVYLAQIYI